VLVGAGGVIVVLGAGRGVVDLQERNLAGVARRSKDELGPVTGDDE